MTMRDAMQIDAIEFIPSQVVELSEYVIKKLLLSTCNNVDRNWSEQVRLCCCYFFTQVSDLVDAHRRFWSNAFLTQPHNRSAAFMLIIIDSRTAPPFRSSLLYYLLITRLKATLLSRTRLFARPLKNAGQKKKGVPWADDDRRKLCAFSLFYK